MTVLSDHGAKWPTVPFGPGFRAKAPCRWLRRLVGAVSRSRQRRADLDIARYLMASGRTLTDGAERDMMQRRMPRGDWSHP